MLWRNGWRLAAGEETGRGRGFLRLSIEYDVEPSFDFVEVYDGSGTQHAQLSGAGGPVLLTIPVDGGAPLSQALLQQVNALR